jgi:hypothetical protein
MPFVGFDWRYRVHFSDFEKNIFGQKNTKDNRSVLSAGLEYTLPMLVVLQGEIFTDGNIRFQLIREDIPITKRIRMGLMINTDTEYMVGLTYIVNKYIGIKAHYDSDMRAGLGIKISY